MAGGHWFGVVCKTPGANPGDSEGKYWIVDKDLPPDHPHFHIGTMENGQWKSWEPWYAKAWEPEDTTATDYREHPETWAKPARSKKRDMSFFQRAHAGRI